MTNDNNPERTVRDNLRQLYGEPAPDGEPALTGASESEALRRLLAVRQLHTPDGRRVLDFPHYCPSCSGSWPCPTARLVYTPSEVAAQNGWPE